MDTRFLAAGLVLITAFFGAAIHALDPVRHLQHDFSRTERNTLAVDDAAPAAPVPSKFVFPNDVDGTTTFGIDVSHHNGDIDWAAVAGAKVAFAYIKTTQGVTGLDPKFATNWAGAGANNIRRGAYHFFSSSTKAEDQAAHFLQVYKDRSDNDLPPVLDLEWDYSRRKDAKGNLVDGWANISGKEIAARAVAWLAAVEKATGKKPVIYTNFNWYNSALGDAGAVLAPYDVWVADYSSHSQNLDDPKTPGTHGWRLWQFTNKGTVPGIDGSIDVDILK